MQEILSRAVLGQLLWQSFIHRFGAIHTPCWPGTVQTLSSSTAALLALWHLQLQRWLSWHSFHFQKPLPLSKHPCVPKPASCQMHSRVTPMGRFPVLATLHCHFHSLSNTGICSLCKGYSHAPLRSSAQSCSWGWSGRLFGGGEKNKKSIESLKEGSTHRLCAPGRSLSRIRQPQGLSLQDKVKEYRGLTHTNSHFSRP